MEKLIIDRSKWRTGGSVSTCTGITQLQSGKGNTRLLNHEGFMCCLGFEGARRGATSRDLLGCPTPLAPLGPGPTYIIADVFKITFDEEMRKGWEYGHGELQDWILKAIKINDDDSLSRECREYNVVEHFKRIDVVVEFTGEYVEYNA